MYWNNYILLIKRLQKTEEDIFKDSIIKTYKAGEVPKIIKGGRNRRELKIGHWNVNTIRT